MERRMSESSRHSDEEFAPPVRRSRGVRRHSSEWQSSPLRRVMSRREEWNPYGLSTGEGRRNSGTQQLQRDGSISMPRGSDSRSAENEARAHEFRRTHSSLWDYWNRLGSGPHDGTILLRASSKAIHEEQIPSDESIDLLEDDRTEGALWRSYTSVMKYQCARNTILFLWILLGLGFAAYVISWLSIRSRNNHFSSLQSNCDFSASTLSNDFEQNSLQVAVLRGLVDTFYANTTTPSLNQSTFYTYMASSAFARPVVDIVMYAEYVPGSNRTVFTKRTGRQIVDFYNQSVSRAAADLYGPVIFVDSGPDPFRQGYPDVLGVEHVRTTAFQSTETGKYAYSAPTLWGIRKDPRLTMTIPFYTMGFDANAMNVTAIERKNNALGWLVACFGFESIVGNLQGPKGERLKFYVYDVTNQSNPQILYTPDFAANNTAVQGNLNGAVASKLNFTDPVRVYQLRCSDPKGLPFPWLALEWGLAIIIITLLIAQLMRSAGKRIVKIENAYRIMKNLRDHTLDAKLAAEQADNSKSQFLATVSHEIRTPLNGVLGMLTLLRDTKLDAVQIDYVQTAVSSGKALIGLINDVLDFSKIEAGKMEMDSSAFDIRAELDDVLSLFAEKVRSKDVELAGLVQLSVPQMLLGDSGRFRQVLINLIGNATKFTEHGHILVTVRQIDEEEDVCVIHGYQPLPVGMSSVPNPNDDTFAPQPEKPQRKKRFSLVRFSNLGFPFTSSHSASSSLGGGDSGPDLELGLGGVSQAEVLEGKNKPADASVPASGARDNTLNGGGQEAQPNTGGTAVNSEEVSMTTPARYSTLSGWPTASGAHTYEEVSKWLHEKFPIRSTAESNIRLAIAVEDTGQGIPVEAQNHIFQPFRQADSSTSRKAGGTGIGLSISRRLVELQGGDMDFVSRPGIGSTFFFDVSLGLAPPSPVPGSILALLPQADKLRGLRVLVVDPSKVRRQVLATHLRQLAITVDFADSVDQAVHMARWGRRRRPPRSSRDQFPRSGSATSHSGSSGGSAFAAWAHLPGAGLARTQSCEAYPDQVVLPNGVASAKHTGRRRSIEGIAEAAKAIFNTLIDSPSYGYFSSPGSVGWSPAQRSNASPAQRSNQSPANRSNPSPAHRSYASPLAQRKSSSMYSPRVPVGPVESPRGVGRSGFGSGSSGGGEDPMKVENIARRERLRRESVEFQEEDKFSELDGFDGVTPVEVMQLGPGGMFNPPTNAPRVTEDPNFKGYAAIFVESDPKGLEKRGLALGERLKVIGLGLGGQGPGAGGLAVEKQGTPLVLVEHKPDVDLEREAQKVGFRATLLKPLRRMSVAVSLVQALGLGAPNPTGSNSGNAASPLNGCHPSLDATQQLSHVLKGKKILCVDDNLVNRRVAAKLLAKYGAETTCASGGNQALDMLKSEGNKVDLVFMDLQMPEMDGYETSEKIRELETSGQLKSRSFAAGKRLPIIAMTADVLKGTREKCMVSGMDGYVTKPIDTNELLKVSLRFFPLVENVNGIKPSQVSPVDEDT